MTVLLTQLAEQPRSSHTPVGVDSSRRNLQHFGNLGFGEATEKTHFHHLALPFVKLGQSGEGLIEIQQFGCTVGTDRQSFIERDLLPVTTALLLVTRTSKIHEDVTH